MQAISVEAAGAISGFSLRGCYFGGLRCDGTH
jgi:hypothetical protein